MQTVQSTSTKLKTLLLVFLTVIFLGACGDSNDKNGQEKKESVTVGIVNLTGALEPAVDGFKAGLAAGGYVEGENVTYLYDGPINNIGDLDAAVQKSVDAHVDLIFSLSTPATLAAKRLTAENKIPVVFGTVTDPIATGVVENLAQPEGNLTGIKTGGSEPKELEWLQTFVPDIQRVFIIHNPNDPSSSHALSTVLEAADKLGIEIVAVEAPNSDAVLAALQNAPEDIDGMFLLPDSIVNLQLANIVTFTLERKLPLVGINTDHTKAGALLAFGSEHFEAGQQAARLGAQILNGITPENLPVETAEFYLAINLQTAEAIGITVSDSNLRAAQSIIR